MTQALVVMNTTIRQDHEGRYCVNDLHRAAGNDKKHQPSNWTNLIGTHALIQSYERDRRSQNLPDVEAIVSRQGLGTFVVKELAYDYARWVSSDFYLRLIQSYDRLQTEKNQAAAGFQALPNFNDPVQAARAWADEVEKVGALARLAAAQQQHIEEVSPAVEFHAAVAKSEDSLSIGEFAKIMRTGETRLFELLRVNGVLITGGQRHNLPYQYHLDIGRFRVVERAFTDRNGRTHLNAQTRVTPKGQLWIQQRFFPMRKHFLEEAAAQVQYNLDLERANTPGNEVVPVHPSVNTKIEPEDIEAAVQSLARAHRARSYMLIDPTAVPDARNLAKAAIEKVRQTLESADVASQHRRQPQIAGKITDQPMRATPAQLEQEIMEVPFTEEHFAEAGRTYSNASAFTAKPTR